VGDYCPGHREKFQISDFQFSIFNLDTALALRVSRRRLQTLRIGDAGTIQSKPQPTQGSSRTSFYSHNESIERWSELISTRNGPVALHVQWLGVKPFDKLRALWSEGP
jgi:hypothetical protein